jgi:hypothetical protein
MISRRHQPLRTARQPSQKTRCSSKLSPLGGTQ